MNGLEVKTNEGRSLARVSAPRDTRRPPTVSRSKGAHQPDDAARRTHTRQEDDGEVSLRASLVDEGVELHDVGLGELVELMDVVHVPSARDGVRKPASRHPSTQPEVEVLDAVMLPQHRVSLC